MNADIAIHLAMNAMLLAFELSLPFLAASLIVGLAISILQAATQIQEVTLTFVPKIVVSGITLAHRRAVDARPPHLVHDPALRRDPAARLARRCETSQLLRRSRPTSSSRSCSC